jgi:hypothetical protein
VSASIITAYCMTLRASLSQAVSGSIMRLNCLDEVMKHYRGLASPSEMKFEISQFLLLALSWIISAAFLPDGTIRTSSCTIPELATNIHSRDG